MAGLSKNKNEDNTPSPISSAENKEKELDFFISANNDMKKKLKEKETINNKKSGVFFLSDYPWEDYEE